MTNRMMVDCTSSNLSAVLKLYAAKPPLWAGYDTGSGNIKYSIANWDSIPAGITKVHIDQGFGSPVTTTATVRDVEPYAWTPAKAVNLSNWHAERPTIYCDRNDLTRPGGVLASGWKGSVWLAEPSTSEPSVAPVYPGVTVVAQQWYFGTNHDQNVVFDPYWPHNKPAPSDWTYGPPRDLSAAGGHTSVALAWREPAGAPVPPAYYLIWVYENKTLVPTYPRKTTVTHSQTGSLKRHTHYTANVAACGPNGSHVNHQKDTFATVAFSTGG